MKKFLTLLLALCLCLTATVALTACGGEEGTASLTYELVSGEYYVSGINDQTSEIVIPSKYNGKTVVGIAEDAFRRNTNVTKVTLPSSVKYIDATAFYQTTNLTDINLENVEVIGNNAFGSSFCGTGYNVVLTLNKIRLLGNSAFESCKNITELKVVSKDITTLPLKSFASCYRLQKVTLSSSVTTIEESAFLGCSGLSSITLENVKFVGTSAFESCSSIKTIDMPKVEYIKDYAFFKCSGLNSVTLGNNVKQIFMYSFREDSGLTSMIIGNSNDVWCGYFVNSNTCDGKFNNSDTFHGDSRFRAKIKDKTECAEFFIGNYNRGSFVCTYEFVESIGAQFGTEYPQNYALYPWQH